MSRRGPLVLIVAALLLTGCFTGERPTFSDSNAFPPGATTGDPVIDSVLQKLDNATTGPATAAYSVLTKFGNTTTPALVALEPGKRSVTVGNTRYIQTETLAATCTEDGTTPCVDGFDPARISDVGVTVDFYAADTATRLRVDAAAKIGPPVERTENIAEQQASCIDIPLPGGVAVYCVLDNGLVAKVDDGAVLITMTLYGEVVDENAFVLPS